jgi:hypothetical protein
LRASASASSSPPAAQGHKKSNVSTKEQYEHQCQQSCKRACLQPTHHYQLGTKGTWKHQ